MDYLKDGIGLRAMAQRDPLIEYQREGYDMFSAMLEGIKEETVSYLFNAQVQPAQPAQPAAQVPPAAPAQVSAQPQQAPVQQAPVQQPQVQQVPAPVDRRPAAAASGGRHAADPTATTSVLPPAFRGSRPADLRYSGPAEDGSATRSRSGGGARDGSRGDATVAGSAEPSRNRPCPCGSGRKYKQCHGSPTAARP
jgi:preprotein translocase subunit SecA